MFDGTHLKTMRKALGLTQAEFSLKYKIPIGSLRNWEQMRSAPDETAVTLLYLISKEPRKIADLLQNRPPLQN